MNSEEVPKNMSPNHDRKIVGWVLMLLSLGVASLVMRGLQPNLTGGLLIYIAGPAVFIVLWTVLSAIISICLLKRDHGHVRIMAGICYALIVVLLASVLWFVYGFLTPFNPPTHRGP